MDFLQNKKDPQGTADNITIDGYISYQLALWWV